MGQLGDWYDENVGISRKLGERIARGTATQAEREFCKQLDALFGETDHCLQAYDRWVAGLGTAADIDPIGQANGGTPPVRRSRQAVRREGSAWPPVLAPDSLLYTPVPSRCKPCRPRRSCGGCRSYCG